VDPDQVEAHLLGDTQIVLRTTKLRPRSTELIQSDQHTVTSFTTGLVEEALFTWKWASLGNAYLVKDARLSVRGLTFKTVLTCGNDDEEEGMERTESGRIVLPNSKPERRRTSLAEIKQEGLVESYIRHQVDHIIDALTLAVEDFEFRVELPPNEQGEVTGITASGNSVELKSVGGQLGGEERLRRRASFVNGGLCQQLSFGSICLGAFKSTRNGDGSLTTTNFPLLEPLSYQLLATRFTGERFSGIESGLKVVGVPVPSSHHDIEEMDILVHAGLDQIGVLVDLGNLILQKKSPGEVKNGLVAMSRDENSLSRDENELGTLFEGAGSESKGVGEDIEASIHGTVWYPSLTKEERKEIEQDYSDDEKEEDNDNDFRVSGQDVYEVLKHDVMKSSIFQFPITGVSVVLPNKAKLTLEALCVNYRADGTVMNFEGDYGAGILIDGFQLVSTNNGYDGFARSRWVVDLITSQFTIEEESGSGIQTSSEVARIRWTETKMDRLIKGWAKLLEAISALKLEKKPGKCCDINL